jgi:hypothetical protein
MDPKNQRFSQKNRLMPMLNNSVRRIDYSTIHIKKQACKGKDFWLASKSRDFLEQRHIGNGYFEMKARAIRLPTQ